MKVTILGTGYVGLTTGTCLAYLGHQVTCADVDQRKIDRLEAGECVIYEPYLKELMADARPNMTFTTEPEEAIAESDVVFIAVGTPPGEGGGPDLRYLEAAAHKIGANLGDHFTVVVNKSTVPIGSGMWVQSLIRRAAGAGGPAHIKHFSVASNPEFLREGTAIFDTLYTDRIVVGTDSEEAECVLRALYEPVLQQTFVPPAGVPRPESMETVPFVSADLASAELIKYAANAFLALKVSYINEIAALAGRVGADIGKVALGIGLDSRIGPRFLQPGLGWGGSCFGKDTSALVVTASEYGLDMPIIKAARHVNYKMRDDVIGRLLDDLKVIKGRTIGLLGLAFKPDTDDLRDAPAIEIARKLLARGARVRAHDPEAMERFRVEHPDLEVTLCDSPLAVGRGADALVLTTDWTEYSSIEWSEMASEMRYPFIIDGRNFLDRDELLRSGFRYGRTSSNVEHKGQATSTTLNGTRPRAVAQAAR